MNKTELIEAINELEQGEFLSEFLRYEARINIDNGIDEMCKAHAISFLTWFNKNVSKLNYEALSVYYKDFKESSNE